MKKKITDYAVMHYQDGTTRVNLYFEDNTWDHYIDLKPMRALLIVDILRNEKPLYWTEGVDILSTGREPVGEEQGV